MNTITLRRHTGPDLLAHVDPDDYGRVAQHRWHAVVDGRTTYAVRHLRVDGRKTTQSMHTFILGQTGIDHVDGDGLNNRRSNLRPATKRQNGQNRRSNTGSSSRFKGVSWNRRSNRWVAQIRVEGRDRWLGSFAAETAQEHFGEFARPNLTGATA